MRIPKVLTAAALTVALLSLCACTGVVTLAHGDPGRNTDQAPVTPVPAAQSTPVPSPSQTQQPAAAPATAPTRANTPPITAAPDAPVSSVKLSGAVSAVVVTFSDHAQQLAAQDPRLSTDDIAQAVERELRAHQLYVPAVAGTHRTLAITVADFESSLASNATLFGYTFRNVTLIGEIQVQGDPASGQPPFEVHARGRTSARDSGSAAGSLAGLYARFATLTVADLRGVAPPEEPIPR